MGLREQVLDALAVAHQEVEVRGLKVWVRALSASQQLWLADHADDMSAGELTFWMLEQCVVDELGERLFGDGDDELRMLDGGALTTLADAVREISAGAVAAKN